jgi:AcrR family transcriptional regulator
MGRPAKISCESIAEHTVRLVAKEGLHCTTIRAISKSLNVNEAAIYRYYKSKEAIFWDAYARIVEEMIGEKRLLTESTKPFRELLSEWVLLTFTYFDRHPDAFTYVLLLPPPVELHASTSHQEIILAQGKLFMVLVRHALAKGEIRDISPELALCHFSGLMLNVPRLIREGQLTGPAVRYVDDVSSAAWRVLQPV